jgi:hypothetical protein
MIDHLAVDNARLKDEATMWRLIQYGSAPLALGLGVTVASTAYPFIQATMHMPMMGAIVVAAAIPFVSGYAGHLAVDSKSILTKMAAAVAFAGCVALSGITVVNSKQYASETEAKALTNTAAETQRNSLNQAASLQAKLLDLQLAAQTTYDKQVRSCRGKTKVVAACKKDAKAVYDTAMERYASQFTTTDAHIPTAEVVKPKELSTYDFILACIPDLFAGLLTLGFFHSRKRRLEATLQLVSTHQPTTQKDNKREIGQLALTKGALESDLEKGTLPLNAVAKDGQIVALRLAKHYGLHPTTVQRALKATSSKYVQQHKGKSYLNLERKVAKLYGVK